MKLGYFFLLAICFIIFSSKYSLAIPLSIEYSVQTTITQLGPHSFIFQYDITNNNQQLESITTGFDGFYLQIPESISLKNIINPPPYYGDPGHWEDERSVSIAWLSTPEISLLEGNIWLRWWGYKRTSVYPAGTTATFSFQADGVILGTASGIIVSYWGDEIPEIDYVQMENGGYYSSFSTDLIVPYEKTPVPVPVSIILFGSGLLLIGLITKN